MAENSRKTAPSGGGDEPIVIRKYANRRLYNTATGTFVTLEDIRQFVVDGQPFVVIDVKSGNDITSSILAQIIADQEARGERVLPDELLREIIGLYGKGMSESFSGYLRKSMEAYRENWDQVEQLGELSRKNMAAFQQSLAAMFGSGPTSQKAEEAPPKPEEADSQTDPVERRISDLQRQLDEMRAKFDELAKKKE